MDWDKYCIIDRKDDKDITDNVISIKKDDEKSAFIISFKNDSTSYNYNQNRISYLMEPEEIDIEGKLIFKNGKLQPEIKKILKFGDWCRILYFDDKRSLAPYTSIQFIKDLRSEEIVSNVMDYLIEVSSLEERKTTEDEEEEGFLTSQLKTLEVREDSVLALYLGTQSLFLGDDRKPVIAPFSSNESQIQAIKNALQNRISVIQGPPGTGKTQTILNIISNLLIRGKTIAVVSGNNEATRNVYEKLEKEQLGSLCATLGNRANIDNFFAYQPSKTELKKAVASFDKDISTNELKKLEEQVSEVYRSITDKARFEAQLQEYKLEQSAYETESLVDYSSAVPGKLHTRSSAEEYLEAAAFIETLYSSDSWEFLRKLKMLRRFGFWPRKDFDPSASIDYLQEKYYPAKIKELQSSLREIARKYPSEVNARILSSYHRESITSLMHHLHKCYDKKKEILFTPRSYKTDPEFLDHYPIVLSTTHALQYCAPRGRLFDYVIIDEASQVNLTSAFLALASARNAVIVGDSMQLPHVVPSRLIGPLDAIRNKYNLPSYIDYRKFSILESILEKYGKEVPGTLLNEHYRCDPEIIGFCNKRFYDGQLIVQMKHKKGCGITIIETPSHTAYGRTNPRQAEIIEKEILPQTQDEDVGVVAPYRAQVNLVRETLRNSDILVDTVHKFQGKERDTMILSTTSDRTILYEDPEHIDFLNNPNLINVAISRAKKHLYVVATSEALDQEGTLLGDLARYSAYNTEGFSRLKTKVYSVFDLMYDDYSPILQNMRNRMKRISNYDSENIIATVIDDICKSKKYGLLSFKFNYPLRKIIRPETVHDTEDRNFVLAPGSHCDFVIFNNLDKKIQLIVEVDGKQHDAPIQKQRDLRKDRLLAEAGLKIVRIKTTDIKPRDVITSML